MFDYNHTIYRAARVVALKRSEGWCQFCGLRRATQTHHWRGYAAGEYKPAEETTADELIALCGSCHDISTAICKGYKEGYSDGHEAGHEAGHQAGHQAGSDEGYLEWQGFFDNEEDFEAFLEWKESLL